MPHVISGKSGRGCVRISEFLTERRRKMKRQCIVVEDMRSPLALLLASLVLVGLLAVNSSAEMDDDAPTAMTDDSMSEHMMGGDMPMPMTGCGMPMTGCGMRRGMRHHGMGDCTGGMGCGEGMRGMGYEGHPMWSRLRGLDLDEKQKVAVGEIRSRTMKEMVRKRADQRIAQIELKDLLEKDPVDMKAVESKLKQIEASRTEKHLSLIRAREEIKGTLRPEQREKMKEAFGTGPMMSRGGMPGGMMRGGMGMLPPCEQ